MLATGGARYGVDVFVCLIISSGLEIDCLFFVQRF